MTLDRIIDMIDPAYEDGLIRAYFEEPDVAHGDGLAKFIVDELRETYDETAPEQVQLDQAFGALTSALKQLWAVRDALIRPPPSREPLSEAEEARNDERCIVVTGNLSEGFRFYGPFETFDDAAESEAGRSHGSWVAPLLP